MSVSGNFLEKVHVCWKSRDTCIADIRRHRAVTGGIRAVTGQFCGPYPAHHQPTGNEKVNIIWCGHTCVIGMCDWRVWLACVTCVCDWRACDLRMWLVCVTGVYAWHACNWRLWLACVWLAFVTCVCNWHVYYWRMTDVHITGVSDWRACDWCVWLACV